MQEQTIESIIKEIDEDIASAKETLADTEEHEYEWNDWNGFINGLTSAKHIILKHTDRKDHAETDRTSQSTD